MSLLMKLELIKFLDITTFSSSNSTPSPMGCITNSLCWGYFTISIGRTLAPSISIQNFQKSSPFNQRLHCIITLLNLTKAISPKPQMATQQLLPVTPLPIRVVLIIFGVEGKNCKVVPKQKMCIL